MTVGVVGTAVTRRAQATEGGASGNSSLAYAPELPKELRDWHDSLKIFDYWLDLK